MPNDHVLHLNSGASESWQVLLGFAFKRLSWEGAFVGSFLGNNLPVEVLDLSPRGTMPVLQADGHVIRGAIPILAWLDRKYPEIPLFGATADGAALIWDLTIGFAKNLGEACTKTVHPFLKQSTTAHEMLWGGPDALTYRIALDDLFQELTQLETLLTDYSHLTGPNPTAVDAVVFPELAMLDLSVVINPEDMKEIGLSNWRSKFPRLSEWEERLGTLPSVEMTYPPNWIAHRS